jgi:hypothetical protein
MPKKMRHSTIGRLIIVLSLISVDLAGQAIQGKINWTDKIFADTNVFITATKISNSKDSTFSTVTNSKLEFYLTLKEKGEYYVSLHHIAYYDTSFIITVTGEPFTNLSINYPTKSCQYNLTRNTKVCPIMMHKDKIVPISYGLPTRRTFRIANRSKVYLGGCVITDCDRNWYCDRHKLRF